MTTPPADRVVLATWPTPMEPAPRLAAAIGLKADGLWLKRDDLTGLAAGDNEIRKPEWTAAAAARYGLPAVLVFPGDPPTGLQGNLLLDVILGATTVWTGESFHDHTALRAAADSTARELRQQGRRPAIVPFGGSNAVGSTPDALTSTG